MKLLGDLEILRECESDRRNSRGSKHWERNDTFSLLGCLETMAGQCLLSISKCLDKITLKASTFLVVLIYSAIALNEVGKGTGNVWG